MKKSYPLFFEKTGFTHAQAIRLYENNPYFFAELIAFAETSHPSENGFTAEKIEHLKKILQSSNDDASIKSPKMKK